jgi:polyisoprenoid-binding protein YceI
VGEGKIKADVAPEAGEAGMTPAKSDAVAAKPGQDVEPLRVDVGRSSIGALGAKVTGTHPVMFKDFSGKVGLAGDLVASLSFDVTMKSLESDHPKLTSHLKAEDFLHVEQFPTSSFVSSSMQAGSEVEGSNYTVTGDLTIRGKSRRLTFPAKVDVTEREVHAVTEFVIDRQDFDVTYPGRPDDLVQDNVVLTVDFVAPRG